MLLRSGSRVLQRNIVFVNILQPFISQEILFRPRCRRVCDDAILIVNILRMRELASLISDFNVAAIYNPENLIILENVLTVCFESSRSISLLLLLLLLARELVSSSSLRMGQQKNGFSELVARGIILPVDENLVMKINPSFIPCNSR